MKRSNLTLFVVAFGFALFAAARLAIFLVYPDYFGALPFGRVLYSFLNGMRFDGAIMMLIIGPIALMLLIPVKFRAWKYFWGWLAFAVYIAFAFALMTDIVYFGEAQRHLSTEVRYLPNESDFIASVLVDYLLFIIVFLAALLFLAFLWNKVLRKPDKPERYIWLKILVCVIFSVAVIRGSFTRKPLTTVDAYINGVTEGTLTINGIYTVYRQWQQNYGKLVYHIDNDTAISMLGGDPSAKYPFLREFEGRADKKNIVLLVMESWSSYYMGLLGDNKFDSTPNFDKLAREGALFRRHYSVERRSIDCVQSLIAGIAPVDNIGFFGFGLEIKANGNIGRIARDNGYETLFIQTSRRRSFYMDSISRALGFEDYYGAEDMPMLMDYPDPTASNFGWDYEGFMFLEQRLEEYGAAGKPFFAVFASGTTHMPFAKLYPPFDRHSGGALSDFLNTLEYADHSLGEFMRAASEQPWFKDTIFIITGDHTTKYLGNYPSTDQVYHVPMLVYSPGNVMPAEYNHITSHLDVLPTMIELAGINGKIATTGRNIFDASGERYAFLGNRGIHGILLDDVVVEVQDNRIVASSNPDSQLVGTVFDEKLLEEAEPGSIEHKELKAAQMALSLVQAFDMLIDTNRWNER